MPVERIELPIPRLQGECITIVLHRHDCIYNLATVEGIEPPSSVLETEVMPLYHTVKNLVLPPGLEPESYPHLEPSPEYKAGALPLSYGSETGGTKG